MKIAILTGASSGLGVEFLKALINYGYDNVWIIARRKERLDELASNFPDKSIVSIPLDVTNSEDMKKLQAKLEKEKPSVSLLINNAGKGLLSEFIAADAVQLG